MIVYVVEKRIYVLYKQKDTFAIAIPLLTVLMSPPGHTSCQILIAGIFSRDEPAKGTIHYIIKQTVPKAILLCMYDQL